MTLLLALALAASAAASEAGPPSEMNGSPPPETAPSSERADSPSSAAAPSGDVAPPPPGPRKESTARIVALGAAGVALLEGLFALYSAWAAAEPEIAGWAFVALSPIAAGSGSGDDGPFAVGFAAGGAGLGLYNALELRSTKYSDTERFWRNMAGWHAAVACGLVADRIARPGPKRRTTVAVAVGARGTPSMLLVGGRF